MTTLFINISDSRCGNCGKDADPYAEAHDRKLGWNPGEGCGAVFTHLSSDYVGFEDRVRKMRPDLIFVDPMDADRKAHY